MFHTGRQTYIAPEQELLRTVTKPVPIFQGDLLVRFQNADGSNGATAITSASLLRFDKYEAMGAAQQCFVEFFLFSANWSCTG